MAHFQANLAIVTALCCCNIFLSAQGLVIYRVLDRSLYQIFPRFLLRKISLLNIVPYMSESRKLPVTSRTFGLGGCEVIMMSLEPQKLVFLL